jgi:Eco57I restriction-modification methylase
MPSFSGLFQHRPGFARPFFSPTDSMLAGFSGHLVSEQLLERLVSHAADATSSNLPRRSLAAWRRHCDRLGPASGVRTLFEVGASPLVSTLGLATPRAVEQHGDLIVGTIPGAVEPIGLFVAPWGAPLDPLWRTAVVLAGYRGAAWCLLFNGEALRVLSARRVHERRFAEFDLDLAADDDLAASAMMLLVRGPLDDLLAASDREAGVVNRSLRIGVLDASTAVLGALVRRRPRPPLDGAFDQALTIVYRILFLLFAEARVLVPLWHPVYRDSYSIDVLHNHLAGGGSPVGLWDAIGAVSRLLHAGCEAGDLRVNAFNGRLFAPASAPLADRRDLDDDAARRAILSMTTRSAPDGAGRERISYRELGVEQLGAVYETLLDYRPVLVESPDRNAAAVSLRTGSGLRKATGTFYTPQSLTRYLVRRTLDPLVGDASPDEILALRILDPAMGSGAFLVAACAYLTQAYEQALVRAGSCHPHDLGPQDRVAIRRTIAERCLFGVDINPMAVQLARLSLWLATLAADRPLSFLDHHIQTGDSLVGAWLSTIRRPPAPAGRRMSNRDLPLFQHESAIAGVMRHALPVRFSLAELPNDSLAAVRAKERKLAGLNGPDSLLSKWKRVADLWCSAWFVRRRAEVSAGFLELAEAIVAGKSALPERMTAEYLAEAHEAANERRFFHWELEFPEVFFDRDGVPLRAPGFDAVVGNPPWDMMRADSAPLEDRARLKREVTPLVRFARDSGVYSAGQSGHANRYQLFVERALALARPGGRIGLVLPWGLAADHGSAALRRLFFSRAAVDALVGLDNRDAVFPIHRSVKFLLATATAGGATGTIACRFGERDPAILEACEDDKAWFPVSLSLPLIERLSGGDLSIPDVRSEVDLAIAERVATLFPPLGEPESWNARFGRELNVTDDREVLRSGGRGLPVVEGKHIEAFRARTDATRWTVDARDAGRLLAGRHLRRRLAYRDVASPTNRLTLIAAMLPAECVSTHTIFCLRTALPVSAQYFLCGLFNSFVLNYLVRLRVATHVTTAIVERLPVPGRDDPSAAFHRIAALARLLSVRQDPATLASLQAAVALLYRFSVDEFRHVLASFPLVPIEERDGALRAFRK